MLNQFSALNRLIVNNQFRTFYGLCIHNQLSFRNRRGCRIVLLLTVLVPE